jgi:hypothetical protein
VSNFMIQLGARELMEQLATDAQLAAVHSNGYA